MRNLKKVLSLSLAFVMLLGMMVVGGSAATALDVYPDAEDITYAEAVDLLTALDILEGDDAGFRPTDTLTREQAAKIVATVSLGVDAAEALSVSAAPFSDVAANRWSAGYIAYCANVGIINGMGDGSFAPTAEVTGYQFAKMLLCCLGYGVNDEYVGANWTLNVSKDGVTTGLFDRLAKVNNAPATREEAAQLAFNALNMNQVSYSALYGTYAYYASEYGSTTLLGTKVDKIFNATCWVDANELGLNERTWKFRDKAEYITDSYLVDEVITTVTEGTLGAMYKLCAWDETGYTVWENGVPDTTIVNGETYLAAYNAKASLSGKTAPAVTYVGQRILVVDEYQWDDRTDMYINDGDADKLIVLTDYLAEVVKVTEETASTARTITFKAYVPHDTIRTVTATIENDEFNKGDMILVTPEIILDADNTLSSNVSADLIEAFENALIVEAAESVEGQVYGFYWNDGTVPGSVSVENVKYNFNSILLDSAALGYTFAAESGDGFVLNKSLYTFYLSNTGVVAGIVEHDATVEGNYAYLVAVGEDAFQQFNQVKVILSNGEGKIQQFALSEKSGLNYANDEGVLTADTNMDGTPDAAYIYDYTAKTTLGNQPDDNDGLVNYLGYIYEYEMDGNEIVLNALDGGKFNLAAQAAGADVDDTSDRHNTLADSYTAGYSALSYEDENDALEVAYVTDTTVFAYLNKAGDKIEKFVVGKNNAVSIDTKDLGISVVTRDEGVNSYASFVVVLGQNTKGAAPAGPQYTSHVYILDGSYVGKGVDLETNKPVYFYLALVNGEVQFIAVDSTKDAAKATIAAGIYDYVYSDHGFTNPTGYDVEDGVYSLKASTADFNGTISVDTNRNVISVYDPVNTVTGQYIIDADCAVVDLVDFNYTAADRKDINVGADWGVGDEILFVTHKNAENKNDTKLYVEAIYILNRTAVITNVMKTEKVTGINIYEPTSIDYAGAIELTCKTGSKMSDLMNALNWNGEKFVVTDSSSTEYTYDNATGTWDNDAALATGAYTITVTSNNGAVENNYELDVTVG